MSKKARRRKELRDAKSRSKYTKFIKRFVGSSNPFNSSKSEYIAMYREHMSKLSPVHLQVMLNDLYSRSYMPWYIATTDLIPIIETIIMEKGLLS